jgi:hypothetical protein
MSETVGDVRDADERDGGPDHDRCDTYLNGHLAWPPPGFDWAGLRRAGYSGFSTTLIAPSSFFWNIE